MTTLICCWDTFVQALWNSLAFHYLLNIGILGDLVKLLLHGYLTEIHLYVHLETYAKMFIATLSTVIPNWKQLNVY